MKEVVSVSLHHSSQPLCLCHPPEHKSGDSCLLNHPSPKKRLVLNVACMCVVVCLCASSRTACNKSLLLALGAHKCVSEPVWPGALSLEQCWDQSADFWQPMSGFTWPEQQSEAHTCTRWLQVNLPASNWTINAALCLLMAAVWLGDAMLPFGRRQSYLSLSHSTWMMKYQRIIQNKFYYCSNLLLEENKLLESSILLTS